MSRIGKNPIQIPEGVDIKIERNKVLVKGPQGEIQKEFRPEIRIEIKDSQLIVAPAIITKKTAALWGLTRALLFNMVRGVQQVYEKKLEISGLGFKAALEGENLILNLGFSHPVRVEAPAGIKFSVEKNIITVSGRDKELVGQTASAIKRIKKPDPYKGKGIKYQGEQIRQKVGKKAATAAK